MAPRLRLLGKLAPMVHRKLSAALSAARPYYSALDISSEHCTYHLLAGPRWTIITQMVEDAVDTSIASLLSFKKPQLYINPICDIYRNWNKVSLNVFSIPKLMIMRSRTEQ